MGRKYEKGNIPWNKGSELSSDHRRKISESHKGIKVIRGHSKEEEEVRKAAKNQGEKFYSFPCPCSEGHTSKRFVRNTECYQCHIEQSHARRAIRARTQREYKMYHSAKGRAREGGLEFGITMEDIKKAWPKDNKCPILGIELESNKTGMGPQRQSPSLDRIDPKGGYVVGNIAVISYKANCIKQNETNPEIFESMARWLRFNKK